MRLHHRPDLARADPTLQIQLNGERLSRVLAVWDVREDRCGVEIDRMAAGGLEDGNAEFFEGRREGGSLGDAVLCMVKCMYVCVCVCVSMRVRVRENMR